MTGALDTHPLEAVALEHTERSIVPSHHPGLGGAKGEWAEALFESSAATATGSPLTARMSR